MSETRRADPTLSELDCDVLIGNTEPPTAHLYEGDGGCGAVGMFDWNESAEYARWFAVPCRDCFPDAPPPGQRRYDGGVTQGWMSDPDLAWQVPS